MDNTKEEKAVPKKKKKVVSREVLNELRRKQLRRRRIFFTSAGVLVLLVILVLCYVFGVYEKLLDAFGVERDVSVEPVMTEISYTPKGKYVLGAADGCIIIYDENGVTGLDRDGAWKWNVPCSVENPQIRCYGSSLILADQEGKGIWAFGGDGQLWRYNSERPVIGAFASASGDSVIVLCSQEDFETSVTYLNRDGQSLSEVFTRKFGTYYMVTGAQAGTGEQLALSGVYSSGGELTGAVVFMRSRDGEVFSTEIAEGQVYPILNYLADDVLFAANSESLRILRKSSTVSQKSDRNTELWHRGGGRTVIAGAVSVNGKYCAVAFCEDNMEDSISSVSRLVYYNTAGEQKKEVSVNGTVRGLTSWGKTLVVYTDRSVVMLNENGAVIGEYTVQSDIKSVSYINARNVLVAGESGLMRISFEE